MENKHILIIDDSRSSTKALSIKLQKSGFLVHTCFDGLSALELMEIKYFDIILMEILLPFLDGIQLLEKIKLKNIKTPIIIGTNFSQSDIINKAVHLGVKKCFIKSNTSLLEVIHHIKTTININI